MQTNYGDDYTTLEFTISIDASSSRDGTVCLKVLLSIGNAKCDLSHSNTHCRISGHKAIPCPFLLIASAKML